MTSGSEAVQTTFHIDNSTTPSGIDPQRVAAAAKIIESGTCKVYKSTRSGFSTSAIIAAIQSNKKVLVISPTNRILEETVQNASYGNSVQVFPNCFCLKHRENVKQDKFLTKLPFPLPKCEECTSIMNCPVTKVLNSDCPVIGITYRKLEALILSKSRVAKEILAKLSQVDIILLDEAHVIALPTVVRVRVFTEVEIR